MAAVTAFTGIALPGTAAELAEEVFIGAPLPFAHGCIMQQSLDVAVKTAASRSWFLQWNRVAL